MTGRTREAEAYSRLIEYPSSHPRVLALKHDIACFRMARGEIYSAFNQLMQLAETPDLFLPAERIIAVGSAARAAGLCGDGRAFEKLAVDLNDSVPHQRSPYRLAPALVEAAFGATALGDRLNAEMWLKIALDTAIETGQEDTVARAETLRRKMRQRGW